MQSVSSEQGRSAADTRGKHRIAAELKRLEQESRFLEIEFWNIRIDIVERVMSRHKHFSEEYAEELEQLEKMEKASASCKEMLSKVETKPDPLLPITNGPVNPYWDRWFEGPQEKSGCRCWIL